MSQPPADWKPTGQRIPSLEPEEWDERTRGLLGATLGKVAKLQDAPQPKPLHILTTLANHSALLEPFLGLMSTLAMAGDLVRRDSEMLALRASWNCRSEFEWGHHREYGLSAGLSAEEIDDIAVGPTAARWTPIEAALLRAADELHAVQTIGDATWKDLAAHYSHKQMIELLFTVGQYTHLSMVANSLGIALEPHLSGLPDVPDK